MSAAGAGIRWDRITLAVGVLLVAGVLSLRVAALATSGGQTVEGWEEVAAAGSLVGSPAADVRIVEFTDYECPHCATGQQVLDSLLARHPGRVALLVRHLPLPHHPNAHAAAVAAECAAEQGRFHAFGDLLYAHQDSLGVKSWVAFASDAGVQDLADFAACMEGGAAADRVAEDLAVAQRLGIAGTPTLLVNGRIVRGVPSLEKLNGMVAPLLEPGS